VATWDDVRRIALGLPETAERSSRDDLLSWVVKDKEALLAEDAEVYFTTPHFNGYPAVLVRLERIAVPELAGLVVEAGR
jgi:hypothetical protein